MEEFTTTKWLSAIQMFSTTANIFGVVFEKKMLKCKLAGRSFQFFIAEFYPPNCYEDLLR